FTEKFKRAAFTGGIIAEFEVPVLGLCFDASVLYVRRVSDIPGANNETLKNNRDYIDIPVNLKYKFGLPVIGKFFRPYLLTGPDFGILVSKKAIENAYKNKAFDFAWNFGAGIELMKHVQIQASYGLGLSKVVGKSDSSIEGKNRYWTVTAAYLF
ncbi:MAG: PorT family protein, partial [Muribaculaceae bacterium]|nr:PorT family protein [Muribaculaceae bacterium]